MKKSAIPAALLLIGLGLSGCPVYEATGYDCIDDLDCPSAYVCDADIGVCVQVVTDEPEPGSCSSSEDCGTNETCGRSGKCSAGDCHFASVGCVRGFECSSASGRWECVGQTEDGPSGGAPSAGAANAGAPNVGMGGEPNGGAPELGGAGGTSG